MALCLLNCHPQEANQALLFEDSSVHFRPFLIFFFFFFLQSDAVIKPYTLPEFFFHIPYETETRITAQNLAFRDAQKMVKAK